MFDNYFKKPVETFKQKASIETSTKDQNAGVTMQRAISSPIINSETTIELNIEVKPKSKKKANWLLTNKKMRRILRISMTLELLKSVQENP